MKRFLLLLLFASLPAPAGAELPDPIYFGVTIEAGDLLSARRWLERGLPPNFMADRIGSGLMIAAWEGNVEMMALFHRYGADVNFLNDLGEQALMHAAWKGHAPAVRWLLDRGAQVNRPDRQWSALHYASFAGHQHIVRMLIEAGANVDARSTNGSTVLMMAAREGHESVTGLLLARGANAGVRNDANDSALQWSLRHGHIRIARQLADAEQLAAAVKEVAQLPPPQRSEPAPKAIDSLLDDIRAARAQGKPIDEVLRAYRKSIAEFTQKPAPERTAKSMVITSKRSDPTQERVTIVYAEGDTPPPMSRLVEQIRAARASGSPVGQVLEDNKVMLQRYQRDGGSDAP
jgi:uncharacterized protein